MSSGVTQSHQTVSAPARHQQELRDLSPGLLPHISKPTYPSPRGYISGVCPALSRKGSKHPLTVSLPTSLPVKFPFPSALEYQPLWTTASEKIPEDTLCTPSGCSMGLTHIHLGKSSFPRASKTQAMFHTLNFGWGGSLPLQNGSLS